MAACHREGISPENFPVEGGRWFSFTSRPWGSRRERRARCPHPGSQTSSSLTLRMHGNHGDPGGSPEGAGQSLTSLNSEEETESVGKSESPIVAMKSGNADGAKGRRYWDSGLAKHAPTPSGLCA